MAVFGYPNDEALPGHPLFANGLNYYGVFEVRESSWAARLDEQNEVSFPNAVATRPQTHFIITFHDSTFECLADGVTAEVAPDAVVDAFDRLISQNA